ncbi:helix-turn-helix transcriptional regulator [Ravibacter arvi]|uniref:Helix-turn-helix transcriptional regulator n=1 Tax=Ravibacter arvi TaxID=2051041 RepID=A0ABP8LWM9_9BACT
MPNHTIHQGRNLKRFREMLNLKQEALAWELGEDWNQQKVSLLEQKETIDRPILDQLAAILKIPAEAIQNFDEENAVNVIANTFNSKDSATGNSINYGTINYNPVEKLIQLHEEKMSLYERMLKEYERMLKEKDEIIARVERLAELK